MKKTVLIFLLFILGCKSVPIKVSNIGGDYRFLTFSKSLTTDRYWFSHQNSLINGQRVDTDPTETDNSWYQGFAGTYLALLSKTDYRKKDMEKKFVAGIKYMLKETNGIFLRNCTTETIELYKKELKEGIKPGSYLALTKGSVSREASKDQILGLVTGMFMLYMYTDDDEIKNDLKLISKTIYTSFEKHDWFLYNEIEKRTYTYAPEAFLHYYGLSRALGYMITGKVDVENDLEEGMKKIVLYSMESWVDRKLEDSKKNYGLYVENTYAPYFTNWWNNMIDKTFFNAPDFNWNLWFYELLIGGSLSKVSAKEIIETLEKESVMKMKHLNIASLYFYLGKIWGLELNQKDFYYSVLLGDNSLFGAIQPNSERIGSLWKVDSYNHNIAIPYDLTFPADWSIIPENSDKDFSYLKSLSKEKTIEYDSGLMYCLRFLMVK